MLEGWFTERFGVVWIVDLDLRIFGVFLRLLGAFHEVVRGDGERSEGG